MFIASYSLDQGAWEKTERAGAELRILAKTTGTNLFLLHTTFEMFDNSHLQAYYEW